MAAPGQAEDKALLEEAHAILAEAKHIERRTRLLKQMAARHIGNLQSKEDTRNGSSNKDTVEEG